MSKVLGIISMVLTLGALVCMTVAFSSYWYAAGNDNSMVLYKYNMIKSVSLDDGFVDDVSYHTYTPKEKHDNRSSLAIFNASLAFCILSWLVLLIGFVLVILHVFGFSQKSPSLLAIVSVVGKFILIIATIFALLSMFIFIGLGNGREQDCRRSFDSDSFGDSLADQYCSGYDFVKHEDDNYQGPTTSWIAVVIGTGFTIGSTVLNLCGVFAIIPTQ